VAAVDSLTGRDARGPGETLIAATGERLGFVVRSHLCPSRSLPDPTMR
jgi:hypothetical protein